MPEQRTKQGVRSAGDLPRDDRRECNFRNPRTNTARVWN